MNVLGLSCFYHDSSACLLRDGRIVAAAQEERFSRVKNTGAFPRNAINFCIQQGGISFAELDEVVFFEKPYLKFWRVIMDHLAAFPRSYRGFLRSMPSWLDDRLALSLTIRDELAFERPVRFVKHHLSHAASAFLPSPFEEAAILTADGVGEWATFSCGTGKGTEIRISREIHYPHSLGMLYTAFTTFLGFNANGGEGKTMGLAGYGDPSFLPRLREIVQLREDGSFRVDQDYFAYRAGTQMWSRKFEEAFGAPRLRDGALEPRHYDLAASVQKLLEEVIVANARILQRETGLDALCLAGGVTLNCVANHKILEETEFKRVFVQPAAGDAGGALGAALYAQHCWLGLPRGEPMKDAYLGPSYGDREILQALRASGASHVKLDEPELARRVARALADNRTVGWFQGRMEFGPRALGNRSILGNPGFAGMKERLNERIKKREAFRPYAPLVLEERAREYFDLRDESPYMLLAPRLRPEKKASVPAITHVDGTARVQTLDRGSNPRLRLLIGEFEKLTGLPMLINTSFNRCGEPVVLKPEHAIDCFLSTGMDVLAIGDFVLEKIG